MKKLLTAIFILLLANTMQAQKLVNTKWTEYVLGGTKMYYTKTYNITQDKLVQNQTGSGGAFDNKPTDIYIDKFVTTATDERVITKQDDNNYMVIVFKNIDANKAQVCFNSETFTSIDAAQDYMPKYEEYLTWYTEAGFKIENAKLAMPAITKPDMMALVNYMTEKMKDVSKALDAEKLSAEDKEFKLAMSAAFMPMQYAESKGYNSYKSLKVFEVGITKFKKDPAIIKAFKDAGFGDILSNQ